MQNRTTTIATYGVLAAGLMGTAFLPGSLTVPSAKAANAATSPLVLHGVVRYFDVAHPDFGDVAYTGHFAATTGLRLGHDRRPLQPTAVESFVINRGRLVPGDDFAARATVLGVDPTPDPFPPITLQVHADGQTVDPFGPYDEPALGTINDEQNPREHVFPLSGVYTRETPLAMTATSWQAVNPTPGVFGNQVPPTYTYGNMYHRQIGFKASVPKAGRLSSIFVYMKGDGIKPVRCAIYSDEGGEPGRLLVETGTTAVPTTWTWLEIPVVKSALIPPGDCWLAFSLDPSQSFKADSGGGEFRYADNDAAANGFLAEWGPAIFATTRVVPIYATYDAVDFVPQVTTTSGDPVRAHVLRDGDRLPDRAAFKQASTIKPYVAPYVDLSEGRVRLEANELLYLFEMAADPAGGDAQDVVVLLALGNDPQYFLGHLGRHIDGIGYRVVEPYRDASGHPIAGHLCDEALGDVAGVEGPPGRGGVTSPETFDGWFRDQLGVNESAAASLTLQPDGAGSYGLNSSVFRPGPRPEEEGPLFTAMFEGVVNYDASAGQFFELSGGDGAWLYVADYLVIDLGGVNSNSLERIDLDRLGLQDGERYDVRLFYAHRTAGDASIHVRTNIGVESGRARPTVTAQFD